MNAQKEITALREEIAKLRERVAVLEARGHGYAPTVSVPTCWPVDQRPTTICGEQFFYDAAVKA